MLGSYALNSTFKMTALPIECSASYLGSLKGTSGLGIQFAMCTHHFIQCYAYLHKVFLLKWISLSIFIEGKNCSFNYPPMNYLHRAFS